MAVQERTEVRSLRREGGPGCGSAKQPYASGRPVGKRFPEIKTNAIDLDPAVDEHVTVNADGIRMEMLENQCTHGA